MAEYKGSEKARSLRSELLLVRGANSYCSRRYVQEDYSTSGFATSLAPMAIPASANSDITAITLRLELCLTAPIAVALASSPKPVLSLLGDAYTFGHGTLAILTTAVIQPS